MIRSSNVRCDRNQEINDEIHDARIDVTDNEEILRKPLLVISIKHLYYH